MVTESAAPQIPVRLRFEHQQQYSRLLLFVKWLFVIPHLIVLYVYGVLVNVTTIFAWFAILFTGRYPEGLFNFAVGYIRWQVRLNAYFPLFMTDRYPPFGEGEYPVDVDIDYSEHSSRGMLVLRTLLLFPLLPFFWLLLIAFYLVVYILIIPIFAVWSFVWLVLLCTADYPRGLFIFLANVVAFTTRVNAWALLLRDDWSLFGTKGVEVVEESSTA